METQNTESAETKKITVKVSSKSIGIFSDQLDAFETHQLVDGKLLLPKTPENFAAVAMLCQKFERAGWQVELSDNFNTDRTMSYEVDTLPDTLFWNPQYQLRDGQRALASRILFALSMLRGVYNVSEVGSGKTPTTIFVAQHLQSAKFMNGKMSFKALVIAPGNLLWQWANELDKFYNPFMRPSSFVIGKGATSEQRKRVLEESVKSQSSWTFITYDTMRLDYEQFLDVEHKYDLVICDESTLFINETTQTNEAFTSALASGAFGRTILLSGTPIRSSGSDLHNPLKIIGNPHALAHDYDQWTELHAVKTKVYIEKVGSKIVRRGVNNIFRLMSGISHQFMGIPSNKATVPLENKIVIPLTMTEEEEITYRAVEMGYSTTPGVMAQDEANVADKIELSGQLDAFRESDSLGDYIATVTEYANDDLDADFDTTSIGLTSDGSEPQTLDDFEDIIRQHEADIESIEQDVIKRRAEIAEIDVRVQQVRASINFIKQTEENEKVEFDGKFYYNETHVELAKRGLSLRKEQDDIKELRDALVHSQTAIREEKILPIRLKIQAVKRQLRQEEQARHSTLRRLLRASCGSQWIISKAGTERELVETYSSKVEWIKTFCETNNAPETKTIIFTLHRQEALRIQRELLDMDINCVSPLTAKNEQEVEEQRLAFQSPEYDSPTVIVLTVGRGVGLNLQQACNIVFFSYEFRGDLHQQNIGRAVRDFSTHKSVNIYYLQLRFNNDGETVDSYVYDSVHKKIDVINIVAANKAPMKLKTQAEVLERARLQAQLLAQTAFDGMSA